MLQPMDDMLRPKRQAIVDRLRRRLDQYRQRHGECVPRFDQSFSGSCEQQNLETGQLQKRFLEGKAKRQAKKSDRKPDLPAISGNLHSSVHVQQKFGCGDYEPPAKLQCGGGEALTKFSVEIVQQLEFTTSAADSQPQQISTNVTVKTHANPIKTSNSPPPRAPTPLDLERECKAECKSEVADDELVSLDECAAALEREPAFPGLAELIGDTDDGNGGFGLFMTDISDDSDFINFDLDGSGKASGLGEEDASRGYGAGGGQMSPAAQTLKHMAEQHQAATGGDWARYRGGGAGGGGSGFRAHAPQDLHMSQHQQLHISHPHHNIQVSAAQQQHIGSSAHAAGMFATYQHQPAAPPMHHQGGESYSVSQSQSISLQAMRQRAQPPAPQQSLGVAAVGLSREHQAKMLQQQQQSMLRAQQHMRPPPPEYKPRYRPPAGPGVPGGPGGQGAWRHLLLQQHPPRHHFQHHHQGYNNMGGMTQQQQQQMQLQQARLQQQQQMMHQQQQQHHQQQQQRNSNQHSSLSHLLMQQNQVMNVQGQMPNVHMSQSQSMSVNSGSFPAQSGNFGSFPTAASHDFSLDFLDTMPASDASALTAQELLNVLDNSFLNDIL